MKKNGNFSAGMDRLSAFFVAPPTGCQESSGRGTSSTWFGRLDNKISIRCLGSPGERFALRVAFAQVIDQYDSLEAWIYLVDTHRINL